MVQIVQMGPTKVQKLRSNDPDFFRNISKYVKIERLIFDFRAVLGLLDKITGTVGPRKTNSMKKKK